MALSGADRELLGIFDRLGYLKAACRAIPKTGTDMWTRADAAADETFENQVKGANATALDAAFEAMYLGDIEEMAAFLDNIVTYTTAAVTATPPGLGYATLDAYLTAKRFRLNKQSTEVVQERYSTVPGVISLANIAGDADAGAAAPGEALGTLVQGGAIANAADITALASPSPIVGRVTTIGNADWTVTITPKRSPVTTQTVAQVVLGSGNGGAVGDVYVFGKQAVSGESASGQKVVLVAATSQFKAGETVVLVEWTGSPPAETFIGYEVGVIDTISANTSITLTANLLHTYSTNAFVYPCFRGMTAATGSGGTASDAIAFFAGADRRLRA